MNYQIQQYLKRAIVQHLDGNRELFEHYTKQAIEEYKRYKHLHVSVGEIMESKGRKMA